MRRFLMTIIGALLGVLLTGCPFQSKVPLEPARQSDVGRQLTGYWIWEVQQLSRTPVLVSVLPFNESEYLVEYQDSPRKGPRRFRAYPIAISDATFWSINAVDGEFPPSSYLLARSTSLPDGRLSIAFVGQKGTPAALALDPVGLKEHIAANVANESLYDVETPCLWRRPRPGEVVGGRLRASSSRDPAIEPPPRDLRVAVAANDRYRADKTAFQVELTSVGSTVWPVGDSNVYFLVDGQVKSPAGWNFGQLHDHVLPGPDRGVRLYIWMTFSEVQDWLGSGRHEIVVEYLGARSEVLTVELLDTGRVKYDREFTLEGWEYER